MVFSFDILLNQSNIEQRLVDISHFVHLFIDELAIFKTTPKQDKDAQKARVDYNRFKGTYYEVSIT